MPETHTFGATNEPGTCLWCGNKLRRNSIYTAVRRETKHGYTTDAVTTPTDAFGWEGNGFFCTLRCGEAFGLAFAEMGRRLEPRKET